MGIKRCPSFSKRPGFPCGLRVLLLEPDSAARQHAEQLLADCSYTVAPVTSPGEALARLDGACSFDVLLADKAAVDGAPQAEQQALLAACAKSLPCIFTAAEPSQAASLAGIQAGAVDFLARPLSLPKLKNIWQHTVRKAMCNMTLSCTAAADGLAAADAAALAAAKRELAEMEVILEEPEEERRALLEAAGGRLSSSSCSGRASGLGGLPRPSGDARPAGPVINYANAPNMALAQASSFYEPAKVISRSGSTAASNAAESGNAPASPASQPRKKHAPVHACPSTRSINSMASCQSTLQLTLPGSPGSPGSSGQADEAGECEAAGASIAGRCMRRAVRHATPATPASKPPLAGKPAPAQQPHQQAVAAASMPAPGAALAPAAAQQQPAAAAGAGATPMPAGLGALPRGMVWGMPMCPLVRAPGIVPPAGAQATSAGAGMGMAAAAWGGMAGMWPGFMPGFVMPPSMGFFGGMAGYSYDAGCWPAPAAAFSDPAAAAAAPVLGPLHVPAAAAAAAQPGAGATGAEAAAALNACFGAPQPAAAARGEPGSSVDIMEDAFDFMLGDIAAEDDLDLLDGELQALEKDGLKLPSELCELTAACELQEAAATSQQAAAAARASFDCSAATRASFDCSGGRGGRVSFDCSAASTATAGRYSFDCSAASGAALSRRGSARVSFEVSCAKASFDAGSCGHGLTRAQSGAAHALLGSMTDLFTGCGPASAGDTDSQGSGGMTHVDSCGMFADLTDLFGADEGASSGGGGCGGSGGAGRLFDVVHELPLEQALRKSSSLAELLGAGAAPMAT